MELAPLGDGTMFEPRPNQNTHWYRTGKGASASWSSDPRMAPASEVLRVGFHDCKELGCGIKHSNTKEDYEKEE